MENILLFSEKFKVVGQFLKFLIQKWWKLFVLIFKRNKEIEPIQLSYFRKWRFEKSYLVIYFKFKNAVGYQLKDIRRTNCSEPIILNLENVTDKKIEFVVYGFFRQETYLIDVIKTEKLITETFKTKIKQINNIGRISNSIKLKLANPFIEKQKIELEISKLETNIKPITLNFNTYNQKEFI